MRQLGTLIALLCLRMAAIGQSYEEALAGWQTFGHLETVEVAVLGTYHFAQDSRWDELAPAAQADLERLTEELANWQPTKIVLEKEPEWQDNLQVQYETYLDHPEFLDTLSNEIYQIGFRLAAKMGHSRLYLFDDHPPFIGSLKGFSFDNFERQARAENPDLFDQHREAILSRWAHNDSLQARLGLYDRIRLLNHPKVVQTDAQRMHLYELRAGIGQSWIGPDWLGRWYQRNLRMISYLFTFMEDGDRILIVVGSNHKWVMDELLRQTPEFRPTMIFPTEK